MKHNLLFYSLFPKNEPIILFKLPIIPPVFAFHRCRIGYRIVKLKLFHYMPRVNEPQLAHKGIPQLVAPIQYCLLLFCTLYYRCSYLKLTLQTGLSFPFKWENVPIILT